MPPGLLEKWQGAQPPAPSPVSAFLLPHKLGSWRHTLPRGHVPLLQQAAATAWPAVSLFCPRSLRGPSNAALPNIAFLKPRPLLIFSFPSPCTLISPASSSNSAIALILAPEALNWPLPPTHLGPKETLPVTNSYYTGHNFCLYSPWPHHPGHCSTGRFLHATGKEVRPRPCPRRRFGAVLGLPGRPSPGPAPTPPAQQGFMTLPDLKVTLRRRILGAKVSLSSGCGSHRPPREGLSWGGGLGPLLSKGRWGRRGSPQVTPAPKSPKEAPAERLENSRRRRRTDLCRGRITPGGGGA